MPVKDPYLGLTEAEFKRFSSACNATYQAIGGDLASARGGGDMKRSELIEVILDADYIRMYGEYGPRGRMGKTSEPDFVPWEKFYQEKLSKWIIANYNSRKFKNLMKKVFPAQVYE